MSDDRPKHVWEIVGSNGEPTGLRYIKQSNAESECADLNKWGVPEFKPYEVRYTGDDAAPDDD